MSLRGAFGPQPRRRAGPPPQPQQPAVPPQQPQQPAVPPPPELLQGLFLAEEASRLCGWPKDPLSARSVDFARKIFDELSLGLHEYIVGCMKLYETCGGNSEIHMNLPKKKFLLAKPEQVASRREPEEVAAVEAAKHYGLGLPWKPAGRVTVPVFDEVKLGSDRLQEMEAYEAQNLLKVVIGVVKQDSATYAVGQETTNYKTLIHQGAASVCRKLLRLDSWFKHRTYLSYISLNEHGTDFQSPTDDVVNYLHELCTRLGEKLKAPQGETLGEFTKSKQHFDNIKDLGKIVKRFVLRKDPPVDDVLALLERIGQGTADDGLKDIMMFLVAPRFELLPKLEDEKAVGPADADDDGFQEAVYEKTSKGVGNITVKRHDSDFQVVDATGMFLTDALQYALDILVLNLRSMLLHAQARYFVKYIDEDGDAWFVVECLWRYQPTFGMDTMSQNPDHPKFTFHYQSKEFKKLKKSMSDPALFNEDLKKWRTMIKSRGGAAVGLLEEEGEFDDAESDEPGSGIPTNFPNVGHLHVATFGKHALTTTSPYLNDPFFMLHSLNNSFYKLALKKGLGTDEGQEFKNIAQRLRRLVMLRDFVAHHCALCALPDQSSHITRDGFDAALADIDAVIKRSRKVFVPQVEIGGTQPQPLLDSAKALDNAWGLWKEFVRTFSMPTAGRLTVFHHFRKRKGCAANCPVGVQHAQDLAMKLKEALFPEALHTSPQMAILKSKFAGALRKNKEKKQEQTRHRPGGRAFANSNPYAWLAEDEEGDEERDEEVR